MLAMKADTDARALVTMTTRCKQQQFGLVLRVTSFSKLILQDTVSWT